MTKFAYSYCVLKYVHDPAAGESLNVGVLAYAPSIPWIGVRVEKRFRRLRDAFRDFDRDSYRHILRRVEVAVERWQKRLEELPGVSEKPGDVSYVGALIWPDSDLSFRFGPVLTGIASQPEAMLDELFDRMVYSQTPQETRRQTEAMVWRTFSAHLAQARILTILEPKVFEVDGVDIKFEHTFKNGKWHVLQPVTMDYRTPGTLEREATVWLGRGAALKEHPELGNVYLLLGSPRSCSSEIRRTFQNVKQLLTTRMPTPSRVVGEEESEAFAQELSTFIADQTRH